MSGRDSVQGDETMIGFREWGPPKEAASVAKTTQCV
jgi:hypothetical protein